MSLVLDSAQARTVLAVLQTESDFFSIEWTGGVEARCAHGFLTFNDGRTQETYKTADEFINAYTFLL